MDYSLFFDFSDIEIVIFVVAFGQMIWRLISFVRKKDYGAAKGQLLFIGVGLLVVIAMGFMHVIIDKR